MTCFVSAVLILASGCASGSPDNGELATTNPQTDPATTSPGTAAPNTGATNMPDGFAKARANFLDHATKALKSSPDTLIVSPIEESPVVQLEQRVGGAWAFQATLRSEPATNVRGWAVANGTVITPEQNLGVLFTEAGAWTTSPTLTADELANRIVWAKGMNHRVVNDPSPPALDVSSAGAGTLTFSLGYREPGPGGAGGGPEKIAEVVVTLTDDHKGDMQITWRQ